MPAELVYWRDIRNLLCVGVEGEAIRDFPDEDLAIFRGRCYNAIVERVPPRMLAARVHVSCESAGCVPVGVENGGSVAAKQRDLVGELPSFFQGDDGECATARRIPIDRDVLGIDLPSCVSAAQHLSPDESSARTLTRFVSHALRVIRRLS